ncbi:MAG: hypothetical protein ACRDIY_02320 [Chloroflexota bacterium]
MEDSREDLESAGAKTPDRGPPPGDGERALDLLSPANAGVALEPAAPRVSPERIDALDGFGLVARDPDVEVSVYVYAEWGAGAQHVAALQSLAAAGGQEAETAINGALLFLGIIENDDLPARFRLNDLLSAFSGRE